MSIVLFVAIVAFIAFIGIAGYLYIQWRIYNYLLDAGYDPDKINDYKITFRIG